MGEKFRVQLPFGQGLDRETGVMQTRPGTFEDLQNLFLHQGKAIIRSGFAPTGTIYDDEDNEVSDVLQGFSLRSERIGVWVSYQATTDRVWVHRSDTLGAGPVLVGEWVNDTHLLGWNAEVPRVSMCEVSGRVFIAHDLASITKRAPTIYYDPLGEATPLTNLQGDFLDTGDHNILFRGVWKHLDYLAGWGYGTPIEDRPELLRVSEAGKSVSFSPTGWYVAGDERDPILTCRPAGRRLIAFKEIGADVLLGSGRADFGMYPLDPLFGCLGSQLAANLGGEVIAWSAEGPRVWNGRGPSQEIGLNLELDGAEPNDLVAEGDVDTAFAAYIPGVRAICFFFGQRVYVLTTRVEGDWKWDYWSLEFPPLCSATLYPGAQDTKAPTGRPLFTSAVASGIYVDVTVTNLGQDGDETLELWLSEDEGAWYLAKSEIVSPDSSQVLRADTPPLTPATDYRGAVRYRRGILYTPGYTDADPWNWPSDSRGSFNTAIAPPAWVSGVWSRTDTDAEQVLLTVTPAVGQEAEDIEVYRNSALIDTISGPHVGNATSIDSIPALGETDLVYEFVTAKEGGPSEKSDPETVWAGPTPPPDWNWDPLSGGEQGYEVSIIPGDEADETEVWDTYDDLGGTEASSLRFTLAAGILAGISQELANLPSPPAEVNVEIQLRHKETASTTDDFSKYSETKVLPMNTEPA